MPTTTPQNTYVTFGTLQLDRPLRDDPHVLLRQRRMPIDPPAWPDSPWDVVDIFHLRDDETLEHLRDRILDKIDSGEY